MTTHTTHSTPAKVLLVAVSMAVVTWSGLWSAPVAAQSNKFLWVAGVDGESMDPDHLDWSDLTSYAHIFKPSKTERCKIVMDKVIDSMSPKLWEKALRRIPLDAIEVHLVEPSGPRHVFFRAQASTVIIQKVTYIDSSEISDDMPEALNRERIVLLPQDRLKLTYTQIDDFGELAGSVETEVECIGSDR